MSLAIEVEGISKQYRLGLARKKYSTLRDRIAESFSRKQENTESKAYLWALEDVSFRVNEGEALAIVGRNGSGKSTLLKILSRITEPTRGKAKIRGRVASLLEVGTGFHPELTGRENIYLSAAILGMKRAEVESRFDEIVEFSDIEQFLDTAVKHYSSGMYMRLAFAVAAHLDPDILLVDEVLAVGDAEFQRKCLNKVNSVATSGRTVLFVSHNMPAVRHLCTRAILLSHGKLVLSGDVDEVVGHYLTNAAVGASEDGVVDLEHLRERKGYGKARFSKFWVEDANGNVQQAATSGAATRLVLELKSGAPIKTGRLAIGISDRMGQKLAYMDSSLLGRNFGAFGDGRYAVCEIPRLPLMPGTYLLEFWLSISGELQDSLVDAAELTVLDGDFYLTGRSSQRQDYRVLFDFQWYSR